MVDARQGLAHQPSDRLDATESYQGRGLLPEPRSWKVSEITYTGWGGRGTPRAAVNWWVNVSTWGHRQIVLDPSLREIGRWGLGGAADPAGAAASAAGTYVVTFEAASRPDDTAKTESPCLVGSVK